MQATDKPTSDNPTTYEAPPEEAKADDKPETQEEAKPSDSFTAPPEEDVKPAEKDSKETKDGPNVRMPIAIGIASAVVVGVTYAIYAWGIWIAIALILAFGFTVFAAIGWNASRQHKKRQQRRSSSTGSRNQSGGFDGFGGSGNRKSGSRNRKPGSKGGSGKTGSGSGNRSAGSGGGSAKPKAGSKGGSGNRKPGSGSGSKAGSGTGSQNRKTGTAARTPGVSKNRNGSGVGFRKNKSGSGTQAAGSGGLFSRPTKQDFANDWASIKKAAKKSRKGSRKIWDAAYGSAPHVADGVKRTGRGIKAAVMAVAPVKDEPDSDRTDDTQPGDDGRTVNDHATATVANSPGGNKAMGYNPYLAHAQDAINVVRNYNLSTDANLYGAVDAAPDVIGFNAEALELLAERGYNENSKGTRVACEDLGNLAKELRRIQEAAAGIREFMFKSEEYTSFMERLNDTNGGASDVSRAHGEAY